MRPRAKDSALREPVLIVGTGRCGSTALTQVVGTNPDWLSLSEVFSSLVPDAFPPGALDGPRFESLLREPRRDMRLILANRLEPSEFLYPVDEGLGRYSRDTGVPPLSMVCLPHLAGVGDDLLDEICGEVRHWEPAGAGAHYRRLFDGLARRFGAERWIERSGGSLAYLGEMLAAFPDARVVHIWRDGLRCSASMARHGTFRLAMLRRDMVRRFGIDPYETEERPAALLDSEYATVLPECFDPVAFGSLELSMAKFVGLWSSQVMHGIAQLAALPPDRVLHLRFEELLAAPEDHIRRLAEFIDGEVDEAWVRRASSLIERDRPSPAPDGIDERTRRIYAGGMKILGDAGILVGSGPPPGQ